MIQLYGIRVRYPILVKFEEVRAAGVQDWRLDNTALKTIRSQGEVPPFLHWSGVDLTHSDPYPVLTLERGNGPEFELVEPQQELPWRRMLNRFDDVNLRRIIGPVITGIFCKPMGNALAPSYDHRRQHSAHRVSFADIDGEPPCIPCGILSSSVLTVKRSDCTRTRRALRFSFE